MINSCDHVFDCIEMGQGYHFHNGEVHWLGGVRPWPGNLHQSILQPPAHGHMGGLRREHEPHLCLVKPHFCCHKFFSFSSQYVANLFFFIRWGTVYATQNVTAKHFYNDYNFTNHPDVTGSVPAVSWWQVGQVSEGGLVTFLVVARRCWACRSGRVV